MMSGSWPPSLFEVTVTTVSLPPFMSRRDLFKNSRAIQTNVFLLLYASSVKLEVTVTSVSLLPFVSHRGLFENSRAIQTNVSLI